MGNKKISEKPFLIETSSLESLEQELYILYSKRLFRRMSLKI